MASATDWRYQKELFRGERGFNGGSHLRRIRRGLRSKPFDDLAVAANQELAEVPLDIAGERGFRSRQGCVEWVTFRTIHIYFIEKRECDVVFGRAKLFDLF